MSERINTRENDVPTVGVNSTVTIRYDGGPLEAAEDIIIVYPKDRSEPHHVSTDSPLGSALLNKKPGEVAIFTGPYGDELIVKVVAIL